MLAEPAFTVGVEEEYHLVDRETRELVAEPPPGMLAECQRLLEGQVTPEFLRSQIEVGTRICRSMAEVHDELARLRRAVCEVAGRYGLAPIAASTHPFARPEAQRHTDRERYNTLARDLQAPARRLVVCGMHVHVGIEDPDLRIDLMSQAA
jgi:carboxylate-amine ligase